MNTRDALIDLMIEHDLSRSEIADMVSVDLATVNRWLRPREAGDGESVPQMAVELLGYKLRERSVKGGEGA